MEDSTFAIWRERNTPPDKPSDTNCLWLGPGATESEKHQRAHIPRDDVKNLAWLPWHSNCQEHGLRPHAVKPDGTVKEIGDMELNSRPEKKKPKAISSLQWAQTLRGR